MCSYDSEASSINDRLGFSLSDDKRPQGWSCRYSIPCTTVFGFYPASGAGVVGISRRRAVSPSFLAPSCTSSHRYCSSYLGKLIGDRLTPSCISGFSLCAHGTRDTSYLGLGRRRGVRCYSPPSHNTLQARATRVEYSRRPSRISSGTGRVQRHRGKYLSHSLFPQAMPIIHTPASFSTLFQGGRQRMSVCMAGL